MSISSKIRNLCNKILDHLMEFLYTIFGNRTQRYYFEINISYKFERFTQKQYGYIYDFDIHSYYTYNSQFKVYT